MWQRKMTKQGSCIEFNPAIAARNYTKSLEATMVKDMSFELGDDQIKTMTILIGLNTSDFTYGKRISLDLVRLNLNAVAKGWCIFPMVISTEFRMRQFRDVDYQEDAPYFSKLINPSKMERVHEWLDIILFSLHGYD